MECLHPAYIFVQPIAIIVKFCKGFLKIIALAHQFFRLVQGAVGFLAQLGIRGQAVLRAHVMESSLRLPELFPCGLFPNFVPSRLPYPHTDVHHAFIQVAALLVGIQVIVDGYGKAALIVTLRIRGARPLGNLPVHACGNIAGNKFPCRTQV